MKKEKPLGGLYAKRKRRDTIPDKKRSLFDLLSRQGVSLAVALDEELAVDYALYGFSVCVDVANTLWGACRTKTSCVCKECFGCILCFE